MEGEDLIEETWVAERDKQYMFLHSCCGSYGSKRFLLSANMISYEREIIFFCNFSWHTIDVSSLLSRERVLEDKDFMFRVFFDC